MSRRVRFAAPDLGRQIATEAPPLDDHRPEAIPSYHTLRGSPRGLGVATMAIDHEDVFICQRASPLSTS